DAGELAVDLQAFVEYRPTNANPAGVWKRLSLWACRSPAAAAAIGLLAALVVTLAVFAGVYFAQARTERELQVKLSVQAERQRDLRITATTSLGDVITHTSKSKTSSTDRHELLASVGQLIRLLKKQEPGQPDTARLELASVLASADLSLDLGQFAEAK